MIKVKLLGRTSSLAVALASTLAALPAAAQQTTDPKPLAAPRTPPTSAEPGTVSATQPAAQSDAGAAPQTDNATGSGSTEDGSTGADVVVTGSRLARAGYDSPTPINVIGEERLEQLNIQNVADALNQIPSFRPINSPTTNNFRVSGAIGARAVDLRGLGSTRTLTLLDGRRVVGSTDNGTVDLNSIPTILLQRSEVVTGGASAAYGANAVAGVVNVILDNKLSGLKADVSSSITERGDGAKYYAALAGGTDFDGGRGHVVAGIEWQKEEGVGPCEVRAWCAKYTNYVSNPGYNTATRTSTNGLPATLVLDHVMNVYNDNGILFGAGRANGSTLGQQVLNTGASALPAALRGRQFDANGNLVPYAFGDFLSGTFQQFPNGNDPTQPYLLGLSPAPLVVPTEHVSAVVHSSYDLTDSITLTGELLYSWVKGGPTRSTPPLDDRASIDINNPFISDQTRATVRAADPTITRLLVSHAAFAAAPDGLAIGTSVNKTYRAVIGLNGMFGDSSWNWDAYYTYGRVDGDVVSYKTRTKEWNNAVDAVRVTAANVGTSGLAIGSIVCRTTLSAPTNGCIPINLFGTIPQAANDRYLRTATQDRRFTQQVAAANVRGTLFNTWAGEVKTAVGGEYRRDTAVGNADPLTLSNAFIASVTSALPYVRTTVAEGYAEISVPLLKDSPIGRSFDVDGAVRYTHYNSFGNATTWKVGGVYMPVPDITFRVTRSRDIRAPTPLEASPNATTIQQPLADPFVGGSTLQIVVAGGNPNLNLEKANTFTAGVVLNPTFVPRLHLSVDYYSIKVNGAIDSLTAPVISNACKNQNLLCDLISFNPNGSINTVFTTFQNLSQLHAEGLELVMDYRVPALGGNFDLQVNGNYVLDLSTVGGTGLVSQLDDLTGNAGVVANINGVPRWRADAVVTYSQEGWGVTAHGRYIPKGILDTTKIGPEQDGYNVNDPTSISTNRVDGAFYLDLSARLNVNSRLQLYGSIDNVTDKDEPKQLRLFGNGLYFDPYGRSYKVGLRVKL
jgi:outer membrane receptor protein involved in Fe transport